MSGFDPVSALRALVEKGVQFVLIGGLAGRLHGSPTVTSDTDVCADWSPANLERLAEALVGLRARLRGVDDDVPFLLDHRTLAAGRNFTFSTDAGGLDILAEPAGGLTYADLAQGAEQLELAAGLAVLVANLDDLIVMKESAGRPKDLIEVEVLGAIRRELEDS